MPKVRTVTTSLPAPLGGWNARDAIGKMNPDDAVILQDWFPGTSVVELRSGYTFQTTGISGQVQTLMAYDSATANKLFGIANGSIYDCTSVGAVGAAAVTGLTNSKFQYANMTTAAGSYLFGVNGADKQRVYDGSAWHADGDGSPYDISNVDSVNLIHVNNFKNRLWYIQKNTLDAWYLPINSIGGAATKFSLGGVFQFGGYLMTMGTWTIDAGYGVDDYAVWITSKGEIAVYRLTDPTTPSGIALVGIWRLGAPVGRRCMMKYGGDLLIITQDGILPLAQALQSDRLDPRVALTDKIQKATSDAVMNYGNHFGWQMVYFSKANQLYLNVPVLEGSGQQQYVMNTITKSWCNFTGWQANCWELLNDNLYFGGNGYVARAWNGYADNVAAITGTGLQAFNYFKTPGQEKQFTMMRPTLYTSGSPEIYGNINTDFDQSDPVAPLTTSPTSYGVWDVGLWDTAIWGGDVSLQKNWQGATGLGYCGAPILKVAANGIQVQWVSTDVVFTPGSVL